MTKVLMVGPAPDMYGGIASVVKQYFDAKINSFVDLDYFPSISNGSLLAKMHCLAKSLFRFKHELKTADVVHVHMASRGSYERKKFFINAAVKAQKPYIIHMHGAEWKEYYCNECSAKKRNEINDIFSNARFVITLSKSWKDFFQENICPNGQVIVLPNAVSVPVIDGELSPEPNILFLGRLNERKNPKLLLEAAADLRNDFPNLKVVLAGDGNTKECLAQARVLGIDDRVFVCGWVDGKAKHDLMSQAQIFCLPSNNEGLPMSILEAMSYGLPVVSSAVGGIPQLIEDGKDGFLFEPNDKDALKMILSRLLVDISLRKEIGNNARKKVVENYSIEQNLRQLIEIYQTR